MKITLFVLVACLSACSPNVRYCEPAKNLTVGVVQREICMGMPASDVVSVLGSPNIVSLDENKDEVWVYDKVFSQVEYSSRSGGVWLLILGTGHQTGYAQKSQRTLTVIVKFDQNKCVKDFTYHSSSF